MATANTPILIAELIHPLGMERKWKVDWIGEPNRPKSHQIQHMVTVYFSPLRDNYCGQITLPGSADSYLQVAVELGVGYLPILYKGALFYQGYRQERSSEQVHRKILHLSPADFRFVPMGRPLEHGSNREAINASDYILGPRAISESRHSVNLIMSDAEQTDGSYVAVSSIEVARFFFCVSSLLSRHLFSSGWEDLIFWKKCNTEHLPDHVVVGLRTVAGLTQHSAPYLAYAVIDELTQACIGSIHQSLQSTGRWHKPALKCRFPLNAPVEIEAEVIQIPARTHHQVRYFVTRILSCKRPVPFNKCLYWPERHSQQGDNFDDPDLIPTNLPDKKGESDPQGFPMPVISNLDEIASRAEVTDCFGGPLKSSEIIDYFEPEDRFPGLEKVELERAQKKDQKYRSVGKSPIVLAIEGRTSSTGGVSSANPVASADLRTYGDQFSDGGLQLLKDAVPHLRKLGYAVEELPVLHLRKFSRRGTRWTLIQDGKGETKYRSRLMFMLLITGEKGHCIVGEIELAAKESDSSRGYLPGFEVGNLGNLDALLEAIAELVAERRGWPEYDLDTRMFELDSGKRNAGERVRHINIETAEALATRIRDSILIELGV